MSAKPREREVQQFPLPWQRRQEDVFLNVHHRFVPAQHLPTAEKGTRNELSAHKNYAERSRGHSEQWREAIVFTLGDRG
jgi:hypothetical protein